MEIPDQIKVRLFLSFEDNIFRKFYWFEIKKDDFYWGSAYKGSNLLTTIEKENSVLINIPEDFDTLPKKSGKHSYHESGEVHFKTADEKKHITTGFQKKIFKNLLGFTL